MAVVKYQKVLGSILDIIFLPADLMKNEVNKEIKLVVGLNKLVVSLGLIRFHEINSDRNG
jgi:hypothetical protein